MFQWNLKKKTMLRLHLSMYITRPRSNEALVYCSKRRVLPQGIPNVLLLRRESRWKFQWLILKFSFCYFPYRNKLKCFQCRHIKRTHIQESLKKPLIKKIKTGSENLFTQRCIAKTRIHSLVKRCQQTTTTHSKS